MIIRKYLPNDFLQIKKLYKKYFNLEMNKELYNYYYYNGNTNEYNSFVIEINGIIVAHNAIIRNIYKICDVDCVVGLSSGGIVEQEYSGLFFPLLKTIFKDFNGDIIIAFPNKNSERFFTDIFKFRTFENNYFVCDTCYKAVDGIAYPVNDIIRNRNYINWRLLQNPVHLYEKLVLEDTEVFYKYYNNEIDILYSNKFEYNFVRIIEELVKLGKRINIVHWDSVFMEQLGFYSAYNNKFVYKVFSDKFSNSELFFKCQMIDSDVF
jgi:hypothetical protein